MKNEENIPFYEDKCRFIKRSVPDFRLVFRQTNILGRDEWGIIDTAQKHSNLIHVYGFTSDEYVTGLLEKGTIKRAYDSYLKFPQTYRTTLELPAE